MNSDIERGTCSKGRRTPSFCPFYENIFSILSFQDVTIEGLREAVSQFKRQSQSVKQVS